MKPALFIPSLTLSCLSFALASCVSGDGDDAWRIEPGDDTEQPAVVERDCPLATTPAGLTLKVCDLPEGSRLEIAHGSGEASTSVSITGNTTRTAVGTLSSAQPGDTLSLGTIQVPAPQQFLVSCRFVSYGSHGTLQPDGTLRLDKALDNAVQAVHCGRVYLSSEFLSQGQGNATRLGWLRVDVDRGSASWLRDEHGQTVQADRSGTGIAQQVPSAYAGGHLLFTAWHPGRNTKLTWSTTGTDAGTRMLTRTEPDGTVRTFNFFTATENRTNTGSVLTKGSSPQLQFFNTTYLGAVGDGWQTDGTGAGTVPSDVALPLPQGYSGRVMGQWQNGETIYFSYLDGDLWSLYGKNINTGISTQLFSGLDANIPPSAHRSQIARLGTVFLFSGRLKRDGISEPGLWRSDGTAAGTFSLFTGPDANTTRSFVTFKEQVYFIRNDQQLWRSDGTVAGTHLIYDVTTHSGYARASIGELAATDSTLVFTAQLDLRDNVPIRALMRSDGTTAGTQWIIEPETLMPDTGSSRDAFSKIHGNYQTGLFVAGNRVVFGDDGSNGSRFTNHLWTTDGTREGTVRLFPNAEVSPVHTAGQCRLSCHVHLPTPLGNKLLYRVQNMVETANGDEIRIFYWISDGTPEGSTQVMGEDGNPFWFPRGS